LAQKSPADLMPQIAWYIKHNDG